ncbi:MAG: hypothetical protein LBP92_11285 [Deltaproteobacteria bacterium]|jgi:hypothetical protein|nr:hypothetical protein [Deltaproteobacteria bacterium]
MLPVPLRPYTRVVVLDFETYYDTEYTLEKLSHADYVDDPRFRVHALAFLVAEREADGNLHARYPGVVATASDLDDSGRRIGDLLRELAGLNDDDTLFVAHNMAFDGSILSRRLGIVPRRPICTMAMARWRGVSRVAGESLASLARHYGFPDKGSFLGGMCGRHIGQLPRSEVEAYRDYCWNDVRLTWLLFEELARGTMDDVLAFISMSMLFYVDPVLELDVAALENFLAKARERERLDGQELCRTFGFVSDAELMAHVKSTAKCARLLERLGVAVPTKISAKKTKSRREAQESLALGLKRGDLTDRTRAKLEKTAAQDTRIPALAKDDDEFRSMSEEEGPVGLLCRYRLAHNSSLNVSRANTLLGIARRGVPLPVPLQPFRALTGRYTTRSGEGKSDATNLQNLPKRHGDTGIRSCIKAPPGHVLVAADSGQIECRVLAWVAGQMDLIGMFATGRDPYSEMASTISGIPAEEIHDGAKRRGDPGMILWREEIGKRLILGSGYGMGGRTLARRFLANRVRLSPDRETHDALATEYTRAYRARFPMIPAFWRTCGDLLAWTHLESMNPSRSTARRHHRPPWHDGRPLGEGLDGVLDWPQHNVNDGPDILFDPAWRVNDSFYHQSEYGSPTVPAVVLPNDYPLVYPGLRWDVETECLVYDVWKYGRKSKAKIYGSELAAHIIQALSFGLLWYQGVRIRGRLRVVANTHDCWIAVVLERHADEAAEYMLECMTQAPPWLGPIPLACEIKIGRDYHVA